MFSLDLNTPNLCLLQSDSLSCVLDQEKFEQGYLSPYLRCEYVKYKKPAQTLIYIDIAIRSLYNSDPSAFSSKISLFCD